MAPKKKAAKKGKGDDDDKDPAQQAEFLSAVVASLKSRIALEQERRDNADSKREEIIDEGTTMNTDMGKDKDKTREIVTKMTRTYKNMEE